MMRNLKLSSITLIIITGLITACSDNDKDDKNMMKPEPVNNAPSAVDAMVTTQTEVVINDMLEGSDPDGDELTYSLVSEPNLGTVNVNSDGSYSYTPKPETVGSDSFQFAVSDGVNSKATATVSITIETLQVDFSTIGRAAFNQDPSAQPLRLNGREFINTGNDANFDDLVNGNQLNLGHGWLFFGEIMKYLFYIAMVISVFVHAEPYTPKDSDVIAVSSKKIKTDFTKAQLNKLFSESQHVGNTERNQGILKRYLEHKVTQSDDPDIHYFYARLLQREHQFDEAIRILSDVTDQAPQHVNAILLKANLLMVKGKFNEALGQCLSLFGLASIETISTCSLDVKSQNGELKQSYEGLQKIASSSSMSINTRHVLAEMAYRLGYTEQALSYLSNVDLKTAPVSLVVLWADAQLAQKNGSAVLSTLAVLTSENANLEDAILLRLAQAEKVKSQSTKWQEQMAKRVTLRELRQDTYHASDLAWYYLTINRNMTKAKYWARINWQQAKLQSDKRLLELTGLIN